MHFRGDRIGDETLAVRLVVQPVEVGLRRSLRAAENNLRMQIDARYRKLAVGVFLEMSDRIVRVVIDHEFLARCEREKSQHVAAR